MQLAQLLDMLSPWAVLDEVKSNFKRNYPKESFDEIENAFRDFNILFDGKYPGYRACNTKFHDKSHTVDAILAMSRLIDGYNISRKKLPAKKAKIALIATILHDTGYIQKKTDREGTGAKYTVNHVERSVEFIKEYFRKNAFTRKDAESAGRMVHCTGLVTDIKHIDFSDTAERTLGYMLGTADLLGQMSSRTYLEKLPLLFREFKEGKVKGYKTEIDLLLKSMEFYEVTKKRFVKSLGGVYRFAQRHFQKRHKINENLYIVAIDNQMKHLEYIIKHFPKTYIKYFKRKI